MNDDAVRAKYADMDINAELEKLTKLDTNDLNNRILIANKIAEVFIAVVSQHNLPNPGILLAAHIFTAKMAIMNGASISETMACTAICYEDCLNMLEGLEKRTTIKDFEDQMAATPKVLDPKLN